MLFPTPDRNLVAHHDNVLTQLAPCCSRQVSVCMPMTWVQNNLLPRLEAKQGLCRDKTAHVAAAATGDGGTDDAADQEAARGMPPRTLPSWLPRDPPCR